MAPDDERLRARAQRLVDRLRRPSYSRLAAQPRWWSTPYSVVLAGHADRRAREAFVERVSRVGRRAEVAVLMDDGRGARANLDVGELEWLDVRAGDIVRVRRSDCGALSA